MANATLVMITTGGTVASQSTDAGAVPLLGAAELMPPESGEVTIRPHELMSIDSSAITVAQQFQIVAAIGEALDDPGVDGVIVTHGTDTMEETAFLADLWAADPRPVVFTGAQFPADHPRSDGPVNIAAAIAAATDPASRGRGVLVALAGDLLPVRGLFKLSNADGRAFDTVHPGLDRPTIDAPIPQRRTRVDLVALYPGVSPGIIASAVSQNAGGIVLAATGSGNTHPDITAEVALAVREGVVVVVSTRVPYGQVQPTYGGGGGAVDLTRAGAILSPWLRAPQARVALLALLSTGADRDAIATFFAAA